MKTAQVIYENGDHRWLAIVRDPDRPGYLIDTNEYLVSVGEDAILLDPGGSEIFPSVFSALCAEYDPRRISKIFASHHFIAVDVDGVQPGHQVPYQLAMGRVRSTLRRYGRYVHPHPRSGHGHSGRAGTPAGYSRALPAFLRKLQSL